MICKSCGHKNKKSDIFCSYCGDLLANQKDENSNNSNYSNSNYEDENYYGNNKNYTESTNSSKYYSNNKIKHRVYDLDDEYSNDGDEYYDEKYSIRPEKNNPIYSNNKNSIKDRYLAYKNEDNYKRDNLNYYDDYYYGVEYDGDYRPNSNRSKLDHKPNNYHGIETNNHDDDSSKTTFISKWLEVDVVVASTFFNILIYELLKGIIANLALIFSFYLAAIFLILATKRKYTLITGIPLLFILFNVARVLFSI